MSEKFGGLTTTPIKPSAFGGGSGGIVDQIYNPESENAQSGKAVAKAIQPKYEFWKQGTLYKVDDCVIATNYNINTNSMNTVLMKCIQEHISTTNYGPVNMVEENFKQHWNVHQIEPLLSTMARYDSDGNHIVETYATKEEIGDIETALDELHAYAQALINGGATE